MPPGQLPLTDDPTIVGLAELTDRLTTLENTLEHALNAAYDNYDPIVAQLSELRREIAGMHGDRETELADRDRLWCEAIIIVLGRTSDLSDISSVYKKFNELRSD